MRGAAVVITGAFLGYMRGHVDCIIFSSYLILWQTVLFVESNLQV